MDHSNQGVRIGENNAFIEWMNERGYSPQPVDVGAGHVRKKIRKNTRHSS